MGVPLSSGLTTAPTQDKMIPVRHRQNFKPVVGLHYQWQLFRKCIEF